MKLSLRKPYQVMIGALFCAGLLFPIVLFAQKEEMPISTASNEARKLFLEGRDRFELVEFATSAQYFERAIAKDPNFALAHLYRFRTGVGGAKIAQEYLAKAVGLVDKVSLGEKYLVLFYQALVEGQGPKRKEYLDKLLELFPADKRVQYLAGGYFNNVTRDFATALKYYGRVTELDKTYAPVYNNIGYCHLSLGNFKEAEKAFVEQIKLAPQSPNPYDSYAELLMRMGRYDESIAQYKKAYDQDPSFIFAFEGVGDAYVLKGDYKAAREYYQKVFDKGPDPGEKFVALDNIASSFVQEGNITDALQTYEKYRALAKEHSRADEVIASYQNEGFILTETGNPAEGVRRYQMAVEVAKQPDTPEAVKSNLTLPSMFLECYALLSNNATEAAMTKMEACSRMVEKRKVPDDFRWMSFLNGIVESQKGNYAKAQEHYSSSWPDLPLIKYYMAVAYEKMGKQEDAKKLFKELENWHDSDLALALVKHRMRKMAAN